MLDGPRRPNLPPSAVNTTTENTERIQRLERRRTTPAAPSRSLPTGSGLVLFQATRTVTFDGSYSAAWSSLTGCSTSGSGLTELVVPDGAVGWWFVRVAIRVEGPGGIKFQTDLYSPFGDPGQEVEILSSGVGKCSIATETPLAGGYGTTFGVQPDGSGDWTMVGQFLGRRVALL